MNTLRTMLSSRSMLPAAVAMAALAATGCVAQVEAQPEAVARAEAPLEAEVHIGLVQIFDAADTLVGYGYTEAVGTTQTFQRFLLFSSSGKGNDLTFRAYDHAEDPSLVADVVPATLQGWTDLVTTLWSEEPLPNAKTYAICISELYEHNEAEWRDLPAAPPEATYPVWEATMGWSSYTPHNVTPNPSPLVWPPTNGWVDANTSPLTPQLDPGDGRVLQELVGGTYVERGSFFSEQGVNDDANAEYFYMDASYQPAGASALGTRQLGNDPLAYASLAAYWADVAYVWGTGASIAVNGCINYHGAGQPSPL